MIDNDKILKLPSIEYFGSWDDLQYYLEKKGNPFYSIEGDLNLSRTDIESLGNLTSVGGSLNLFNCKNLTSLGNLTSVGGYLILSRTKIDSLGNLYSVGGNLLLPNYKNLTSLGNLTSVGGSLDLRNCVKITSLENLTSVGGSLDLVNTSVSRKYSEEQIRQMIDIKGLIFF